MELDIGDELRKLTEEAKDYEHETGEPICTDETILHRMPAVADKLAKALRESAKAGYNRAHVTVVCQPEYMNKAEKYLRTYFAIHGVTSESCNLVTLLERSSLFKDDGPCFDRISVYVHGVEMDARNRTVRYLDHVGDRCIERAFFMKW